MKTEEKIIKFINYLKVKSYKESDIVIILDSNNEMIKAYQKITNLQPTDIMTYRGLKVKIIPNKEPLVAAIVYSTVNPIMYILEDDGVIEYILEIKNGLFKKLIEKADPKTISQTLYYLTEKWTYNTAQLTTIDKVKLKRLNNKIFRLVKE